MINGNKVPLTISDPVFCVSVQGDEMDSTQPYMSGLYNAEIWTLNLNKYIGKLVIWSYELFGR